jgi:hypothetical protein
MLLMPAFFQQHGKPLRNKFGDVDIGANAIHMWFICRASSVRAAAMSVRA